MMQNSPFCPWALGCRLPVPVKGQQGCACGVPKWASLQGPYSQMPGRRMCVCWGRAGMANPLQLEWPLLARPGTSPWVWDHSLLSLP